MAVLEVLKLNGNTTSVISLKTRIPEVNFQTEDIGELIATAENLRETLFHLYKEQRAIGLAANQVGIMKRMVALVLPIGIKVLVNPQIIKASKETVLNTEGCLSIPNYIVKVRRPRWVVVRATEIMPNGVVIRDIDYNFKRFPSIFTSALLHEIDHLNGILIRDRV